MAAKRKEKKNLLCCGTKKKKEEEEVWSGMLSISWCIIYQFLLHVQFQEIFSFFFGLILSRVYSNTDKKK